MSSSNYTKNVGSYNRSCGNWSGINIAAMVLGFVFFWPIGLLIMFWIMSGRNAMDLPKGIRSQWSNFTESFKRNEVFCDTGHSDNVVFNEYQQTQYDRIHEIKEEVKAQSQRFKDFRANIKRRADEEEFNRFMADKPVNTDG